MKTPQRFLFLILLSFLTFTFAACNGGGNSLVGDWALDTEATIAAAEEDDRDEDAALAAAFMAAMNMRISFTSDGTFEMTMTNPFSEDGGDETQSGTYEVISQDGNAYTVRVEQDGDEAEESLFTVDGNTMTMDSDGQAAVFTRQ